MNSQAWKSFSLFRADFLGKFCSRVMSCVRRFFGNICWNHFFGEGFIAIAVGDGEKLMELLSPLHAPPKPLTLTTSYNISMLPTFPNIKDVGGKISFRFPEKNLFSFMLRDEVNELLLVIRKRNEIALCVRKWKTAFCLLLESITMLRFLGLAPAWQIVFVIESRLIWEIYHLCYEQVKFSRLSCKRVCYQCFTFLDITIDLMIILLIC